MKESIKQLLAIDLETLRGIDSGSMARSEEFRKQVWDFLTQLNVEYDRILPKITDKDPLEREGENLYEAIFQSINQNINAVNQEMLDKIYLISIVFTVSDSRIANRLFQLHNNIQLMINNLNEENGDVFFKVKHIQSIIRADKFVRVLKENLKECDAYLILLIKNEYRKNQLLPFYYLETDVESMAENFSKKEKCFQRGDSVSISPALATALTCYQKNRELSGILENRVLNSRQKLNQIKDKYNHDLLETHSSNLDPVVRRWFKFVAYYVASYFTGGFFDIRNRGSFLMSPQQKLRKSTYDILIIAPS